MSTEIEPASSTELAQQEQGLIDDIKSRFDQRDLVLPLLKLTQQLSREVTEGEAESGQFVNSLTGQNYGSELEVVIAGYFKGRFYTKKGDDKVYVSNGDVIPETWPHPDAGKLFADSAEAEEVWRERVNAGEQKWESGPPISTTHNFIGYVVGEDEAAPVRLSLMKTSTPAARKITTLIAVMRAPWDRTFKITAERQTDRQSRPYFTFGVTRGGETSPEQKEAAVSLATSIRDSQTQLVGDEPESKRERPQTGKGAVEVS